MPSDSTLTLFIPDLFGFQSTLSKLSQDELSQLPEIKMPVLDKWLSRGVIEKSNYQEDSVFSEFGLSLEKDCDKPYAALSLLAENTLGIEFNPQSYWLRADPVNLKPDGDTALLTVYEELALSQYEANQLVDIINEHFIDEPWQLYAFSPHRWYLRLDKPAKLLTTLVDKVLGDDINPSLPTGDDADYWFKINNELQMLLHGSNVNFERESKNIMTVNSLWLWGGGALPENNLNSYYDKIITNNVLFSGFGYYCGFDVLPLDDDFLKNIKADNNVVILDMLAKYVQHRDLYTFVEKLNEIEISFLSHCNDLLLKGNVGKIKLITDAGVIIVTKKHLRRWWKRVKPFSGFNYA